MKSLLLGFSLVVGYISCYDLYQGDDFGARMSYREVKKHGLLFWKRQETVILDYPIGTNITGIACIDLDPDKKGIAAIVDGGVNYNFVHINLESERGVGLRYIIEVYSSKMKKKTMKTPKRNLTVHINESE